MTYEEKLQEIVNKLKDERDLTRKGHKTKVAFDDGSFTKIRIKDICKILLKLQDDEGAIKILDGIEFADSVPTENVITPSDDDSYESVGIIIVELDGKFDGWYEKRLIADKSRLENLSETNFNNINHIMHLIEEQLELDQSEKLTIDFISSAREIEGYEPEDVNDIINTYTRSLTYLKNIGVVKDFTTAYMTLSSELTLDIARFFEVLEQINNVEQRRKNIKNEKQEEKSLNKAPDKTTVLYEITYTKQRQVLMNNAQISKPDFNSENDLVFSFLYEHPNKRIGIGEIEKAVGGKLTKSLHKIVENLGFEGDTKEVFFSVSKNAIEFRNPITKKDLEEMKKPLIRLVKGGGKLVIPH